MSVDLRSPSIFLGPVPVTAETGAAFGGAGSPLGLVEPTVEELLPPAGYVEEEFFVSGVLDGQSYTTTLLVRRPANLSRWSGLVALETVHVQGALGLWQTSHAAIIAGGHAWIALGSQRVGVEGPIKLSNPARYAALELPVTEESRKAGEALDTWSRSDSTEVPPELFAVDAVSNAIMTQVGAALKTGAADGPFGARPVSLLIMGGASQTGVATLNYIKEANAAARMPDGSLIYDGFLPMAAPGWTRIEGGGAAVIQIFAEGDLPLFGSIGPQGYLAAKPDSDAPDDRFRCYQITGASHLPTRGLAEVRGFPPLGIVLEPGERFTQFPAAPFYQGAFVNLVDWIRDGKAPPHAEPIAIANGDIVRDALGNATGGLRSPYVDVPAVRYVAARYVRNLIGVEMPLAPERLHSFYPSREDYLERFDKEIDGLVAETWLSAADGEALKAQEAARPPL